MPQFPVEGGATYQPCIEDGNAAANVRVLLITQNAL